MAMAIANTVYLSLFDRVSIYLSLFSLSLCIYVCIYIYIYIYGSRMWLKLADWDSEGCKVFFVAVTVLGVTVLGVTVLGILLRILL